MHVLAQGGLIRHERDARGRIVTIHCFTREGMVLSLCDMSLFNSLRRKGLIASVNGQPYRISLKGRRGVRARPDNR